MLTRPSRANSPRKRLVSSGCSSCSPSAFGRPAFGWHATHVGAIAARSSTKGRISRRAERAVDADDERLRVLDRDPERLDGLRGEVPATAVDRREREPERQLGRGVLRGEDRGLAVERVEDGLDEEQVDAAVAERARSAPRTSPRPRRTSPRGTPGRRPVATARARRLAARRSRRRCRQTPSPPRVRAALPRTTSPQRSPATRSRPGRYASQ